MPSILNMFTTDADLLQSMMDSVESDRQQGAADLGLTETEFAFYNTLMAEVQRHTGEDEMCDGVHDEIKATTQALVTVFEEATDIVDFFSKPDEIRRMKRNIKRAILECSFEDRALVNVVQDRFMELAQTKFGS